MMHHLFFSATALSYAPIPFVISPHHAKQQHCASPQLLQGYQKGCSEATEGNVDALKQSLERESIKQALLRVCATCSRGFGASATDRAAADGLIEKLVAMSPTAAPTDGIEGAEARWMGRGYDLRYDDEESAEAAGGSPLEGRWRLVYTDALDVLGLDASPLVGVGPIYQDICLPGTVTNVINVFPRAAALLPTKALTPSGTLSTFATLRVSTRARARGRSRVGLTFESVAFDAQSLLGVDVTTLLPQLSVPLPRLPGSGGADSDKSPAFFDIAYLDREMLIIVQNAPGGTFVAVREEDGRSLG